MSTLVVCEAMGESNLLQIVAKRDKNEDERETDAAQGEKSASAFLSRKRDLSSFDEREPKAMLAENSFSTSLSQERNLSLYTDSKVEMDEKSSNGSSSRGKKRKREGESWRDDVVSWMKNNLEIRSTGSLSASEIGRALQECSTELRNPPPTYLANNQIGRLLHQALPALKRKKISIHGKREWVYHGLNLSPNDQPEDCSASDNKQHGNSVELFNTRTIFCAEQCSICDICRQLPWYMVQKSIKNFEAVSDVKDEFTRLCFILTRVT